MKTEDTISTLGAAPRLHERTEGHIGTEIVKHIDRPATTVAVEVGVDVPEVVVEASKEIDHHTMEVRPAEK